tara:strand:- start:4 stop:273 length:270 start_codon:yes stop_codon:yes gene_type:complete
MFERIKNYRRIQLERRATYERALQRELLVAVMRDINLPTTLRIVLFEYFMAEGGHQMNLSKASQSVFKREIRGLADDLMRLADEMERNG